MFNPDILILIGIKPSLVVSTDTLESQVKVNLKYFYHWQTLLKQANSCDISNNHRSVSDDVSRYLPIYQRHLPMYLFLVCIYMLCFGVVGRRVTSPLPLKRWLRMCSRIAAKLMNSSDESSIGSAVYFSKRVLMENLCEENK